MAQELVKVGIENAGNLSGPFPGAKPGVRKSKDAPTRTRGVVSLWSPELEIEVVARHLEAPQVLQERAGGWEEVKRPGLLPLTTWQGSPLLKLKLVLLLDGYGPPKKSVEPLIGGLRRFGYRVPGGKTPPSILVAGAVPYSRGGIAKGSERIPPDWVLSSLLIVEELHTSSGSPCRAVATLELLEHAPASLEIRKAKAEKATTYTWKKGDTLSSVAKRKLGAAAKADQIRKANPKIKTWSKVPAGTRITIPGRSA